MPRIVVLNVKLLGALHWSQGRQVRMEDGSGAQEEPSLVGLRAQGLSRGGVRLGAEAKLKLKWCQDMGLGWTMGW